MVPALVGFAFGIISSLGGGVLLALGLGAHLVPGLASPVGGGVLAFLGLTLIVLSALWAWTVRVLERDLPLLWTFSRRRSA